MRNIEAILRKLAEDNGIIKTKDAVEQGISRATLHLYAKRGTITRAGHGLYTFSDDIVDDLLVLSQISENMIFSHETALFLNGLSDRTPFVHTVTIPRDKYLSARTRQVVECYYVAPELHKIGREMRNTTFGHPVPCYDAERTICDIISRRKRIDEETFISGIVNYSRSKDKNLVKLMEYARQFGIEKNVKHQLEGLI